MKTVKFNIITPKGYIFNSSILKENGENKLTHIMYTSDVHEAQKFDAPYIEKYLYLYEKETGVLKGQGLGVPKYRTKIFIIRGPKGYVYDYELSSNKVTDISYTDDLQDAMQIPESEVKEISHKISNFINVPLFGGMGYSEVKVTYAD